MEAQGIKNLFIAYSHKDVNLIFPIVRLLRVGWSQRLVFYDVDSITPGKKWREERDEALTDADLVVVFWCFHSSKSDEVQYEYQAAISAEKDLLPLLLDATPLPADLHEFQWIDFQNLSGSSHNPPQQRQERQEQREQRQERQEQREQRQERQEQRKIRVFREGFLEVPVEYAMLKTLEVPVEENLEIDQYAMLKTLEEEFSRRTGLPAPQLPYLNPAQYGHVIIIT